MWAQTWGFLFLMTTCLQNLACCAERVSLDQDGKYNVSWTYDDTDITFTLQVETTGWIGFGFSPNGGMLNADIVTLEPTGDGEVITTDRYTLDQETLPYIDDEQDWVFVDRTVTDGITTVKLSRKLLVCRDNAQDIPITSDTMRLIYAYGPSNNLQYHGTDFRGTKSMYLLVESTNSIPDPPSNVLYHDFVMDDHTILAQETTYWCELQKMPTVTKKHHAISFRPIVQPGNELYVHHLVVFGCYGLTNGAAYVEASNHSHECFAGNMPETFFGCLAAPMFVWAVGGGTFHYPEEAGVAIGDGTAPDYVLLEMHYDNPHKTAGIRDSSGIQIAYTETLRPYDVGVFFVGSVTGIVVPPKRQATDIAFGCSPFCTEHAVPDTGLQVFASFLHSHLLGRKISLRHTKRNGSSEIIIRDHTYDFNFQETRHLSRPSVINKGDSMQITCTMDSRDRTNATYGGNPTTEEMCLTFLYYYPRTEFTGCTSFPILEQGNTSRSFYTGIGVDESSLASGPYQDVRSATRDVDWTPENGQILADSYFEYDHTSYCRHEKGFYSKGNGDIIKKETLFRYDNTLNVCKSETLGSAGSSTMTSLGPLTYLLSFICVLVL